MSGTRSEVRLSDRVVTLVADEADAQRLARAWPLGVVRLEGGKYGLVLGTDEHECWAVKLQLPDLEPEYARHVINGLYILAAGAAAELAKAGHPGLIVPTAYRLEKDGGLVEGGIAVFAWQHDPQGDYQDWLLDVASRVAKALPKEIPGLSLPDVPPFVGLDLRPRSAVGDVFLGVAALDGELLLLSHSEPPTDSVMWEFFCGRSEISHVPMVGIVISGGPDGGGSSDDDNKQDQ